MGGWAETAVPAEELGPPATLGMDAKHGFRHCGTSTRGEDRGEMI
jgi:hypothetical protein